MKSDSERALVFFRLQLHEYGVAHGDGYCADEVRCALEHLTGLGLTAEQLWGISSLVNAVMHRLAGCHPDEGGWGNEVRIRRTCDYIDAFGPPSLKPPREWFVERFGERMAAQAAEWWADLPDDLWSVQLEMMAHASKDTPLDRMRLFFQIATNMPEQMSADEALTTLKLLDDVVGRCGSGTVAGEGMKTLPALVDRCLGVLASATGVGRARVIARHGRRFPRLLTSLHEAGLAGDGADLL
jgi:hypothetical protein